MNGLDTFASMVNPQPDGRYYPLQPREQVPYPGNLNKYAFGPGHTWFRTTTPPPVDPAVLDPWSNPQPSDWQVQMPDGGDMGAGGSSDAARSPADPADISGPGPTASTVGKTIGTGLGAFGIPGAGMAGAAIGTMVDMHNINKAFRQAGYNPDINPFSAFANSVSPFGVLGTDPMTQAFESAIRQSNPGLSEEEAARFGRVANALYQNPATHALNDGGDDPGGGFGGKDNDASAGPDEGGIGWA